jgi:hypothetical protein
MGSWVLIDGELSPKFHTGGRSQYSRRNLLIGSRMRNAFEVGADDAHRFGQGL